MASDFRDTPYGPIVSDYEVAPLGELCVPDGGVQTGPFGSQLHSSDYMEYGTPIITVEHLGDNRIIHRDLPCVSEEDRDRLAKFALKTDDIVFSRVGSVDRRAIVHPEEDGWLFSGRCLRVRPNIERINAGYLSWFFGLPGFKEHIRKIAVGATMPSLNTTILSNVPIYFPPQISEQRAIAAILGALDDKIELNRRMNATLEGIARALFKSWFVDFDPVRAKAEGRRMKDQIAALFPDALMDSELGEIPKGWRVEPIGNVVKVVGGGTPSTKNSEYWNDGVHYFATPKDMSALSAPILLETERKVTDAGLAKISSGLLPVGTVLLSSRAPVGYLALAQVPVCVNQGFIAMICDGSVSNYYILNWTFENMDIIKGRASGTTFAEISKQNFRPILALVPPDEIITAYDELVTPLYAKLTLTLQQSRTLAALRDTLLPKLLSGELRVPDVERIIGRNV